MTLEEKIQQLNQQAFGLNLNANNQGQTLHDVAPDIGSLIFLNEDPVERNSIQRRAMEESRLGIPILFGFLSSRAKCTVRISCRIPDRASGIQDVSEVEN
jgi:hypothetical protein